MSHGDYDLTNEDDIKLYLENIETEYSYQCLSEKDPGGKWEKEKLMPFVGKSCRYWWFMPENGNNNLHFYFLWTHAKCLEKYLKKSAVHVL